MQILVTLFTLFLLATKFKAISNHSPERSLQLAIQENGSLRINHSALTKFLKKPEIQNKPLAIISIAGSKRTGKSFLMNFFLRYLRNHEKKNWLGGPDKLANEGFEWRGGHKPNTTGINIWDEYLTLRNEDGEEVVVLLMDTQGLFDHEVTKETNVKLFTFSTIASSVQILNIMNMIEERDLENLHLCVDFAVAASGAARGAAQLQNLMMLIRNWPHEQDQPFGLRGGRNYLEEVLEKREGLAENNNVRKYLKSSFKEIECYLMPHPGLGVRKADFSGANKDISVESLLHTESFVEHLLSPQNLVVKQWHGKPMTAQELLNLILSCDEAFLSGELPSVQNMLEANAKAHYSIAKERSRQRYQECMKEHCSSTDDFPASEDLKALDESCKNDTVFEYNSTIEIGSAKTKDSFRASLIEDIAKDSKLCWDNIEIRKNAIITELKEVTAALAKSYKANMEQHIPAKSICEADLSKFHQMFSQQALTEFEKKAQNYKNIPEIGKLQSDLENGFGEYYELQKIVNMLKINKEKGEENNERYRREIEKLKESQSHGGGLFGFIGRILFG